MPSDDAMIIVFSEERGKISVAMDGRLQRNLTANELKRILIKGYEYGDVDVK